MILLFVLLSSLFTPATLQEFGDIQHILRFAFGNQLNTVMSSCCVIRQLQCPRPPRKVTSYRNVTNDLARGVESFSSCICHTHRRCVLFFPPLFLPDGADVIAYDVTFVTMASTARYTCTYRSTRALVCQYRQSMRTGIVGWLMPGLGTYGPLEVLGSAGLLGEEMEEAMEALLETGLRPGSRGRSWQRCRRCIPLQCAVRVAREAERLGLLLRRSLSAGRQRRRYHWCLRQNSMRPPQPSPPLPPTSTTTVTATTSSTTTVRPYSPFPLIPPPNLPRPRPPASITAPPRPRLTTPKTTTTRLPPLRPTTTTTTTTTIPTVTTIIGTTTTTTAMITTTRTFPTTADVQTDSPNPTTPPLSPTPRETSMSSTGAYSSSASSVVTSPPKEVTTTTTSSHTTSSSPMTSTTTEGTTTTPQVITRILVGSPAASPSSPPRQNAAGVVTEIGGGMVLGGAEVAGVVIGMAIVVTTVICIVLIYRRRGRRHTLREEVDGVGTPTSSRDKRKRKRHGKHQKARNLPSVSSKKAVLDGEDVDNVSDRMEDENDDDSYDGENMTEEPYVPDPTSVRSRKAQLSSKSSAEEDDGSLYASLDDTAISSPSSPSMVNVYTDPAVCTEVANMKKSDVYNTASLISDGNDTQSIRDSSFKVTAIYVTPGSTWSGEVTKKALPDPKAIYSMASSLPGNDAPSESTTRNSKYYNLRPGSFRDVSVSISKAGSSGYINVLPSSASHYDQPCTSARQHVYTGLAINGPSACRASSGREEPYYLEPCPPHRNPRRQGMSPSSGPVRRNSSPVAGHSKVARTSSGTTSPFKTEDRGNISLGRAVRQESLRSNRSRENTSLRRARSVEEGVPGCSRTSVSLQDAKSPAHPPAVPPRADHDGYLLPISPRQQQL